MDERAGAYTVLRCDFNCDDGTCEGDNNDGMRGHTNNSWNVWGRDFHLQRLKSSFLRTTMSSSSHLDDDTNSNRMDQAMQRSDAMLDTLLTAWERTEQPLPRRSYSVMVTLLWTAVIPVSIIPATNIDQSPTFTIQVRGHVCGAPRLSSILDRPTLNVTLALPVHTPTTRNNSMHNMPRRYDNIPDAKVSSWCRERRPLEQLYKPPFAGEVLLVRPHGTTHNNNNHNEKEKENGVELLEGLTSNLFVLLRNGTLQTASHDHVLGGYVRHLILELLSSSSSLEKDDDDDDDNIRSSMDISHSPILLQDSHTWCAVFLTSSIRILIPIRQMFIPIRKKEGDAMNMEFKELWSMNNDRDGDQSQKVVQHIYSKILRNQSNRS
eukprot:scaffold43608_cov55-Attheya_sp.AAC.4